MDFVTGYGINTEIFPPQMPNKNIFLSSAEGVDSELFDQYKLCFNKMLLGDPNYFVADINYEFSLHPYMNGKPTKPQYDENIIKNAFETNPYKANREYGNIFDRDGGEDVFVKRSTINKYSQPYYPVYQNDGTKKYLIAYDPATKLDNSIVTIAELFRDEERGLMVKFVNCVNLVEILSNGEKAVMQKPKQIERIKDLIVDYNLGALDFENIVEFSIDAGAGGCVLKPPCKEIYIKINTLKCQKILKGYKLQHKIISLSVNAKNYSYLTTSRELQKQKLSTTIRQEYTEVEVKCLIKYIRKKQSILYRNIQRT